MSNKPDAYGTFSTDLAILKRWAKEKGLTEVESKAEELQTLLDDYEATNREDKS